MPVSQPRPTRWWWPDRDAGDVGDVVARARRRPGRRVTGRTAPSRKRRRRRDVDVGVRRRGRRPRRTRRPGGRSTCRPARRRPTACRARDVSTVPSVAPGTPPSRGGRAPRRRRGRPTAARTSGSSSGTSPPPGGRRSPSIVGADAERSAAAATTVADARPRSAAWSTAGTVRTSSHTIGAGRHHVHLHRLAGPQHGRRDPRTCRGARARRSSACTSASRSASAACTAPTARFGLRPWNGIAPWAITPVKLDAQPQRALGDVADLAALRLAADHAVDAVGAAGGDEVLGAGHHPLLVDERGEHDAARERHAGAAATTASVANSIAATPAFMSADAAPVDPAVDDLGRRTDRPSTWRRRPRSRRRCGPRTSASARPATVDDGDHVGPARRDDVEACGVPAERPHLLGDQLGGRLPRSGPRAGSCTLGMRTSSWVNSTRASASMVTPVAPSGSTADHSGTASGRRVEATVGRGPAAVDEQRRAGDVAATRLRQGTRPRRPSPRLGPAAQDRLVGVRLVPLRPGP